MIFFRDNFRKYEVSTFHFPADHSVVFKHSHCHFQFPGLSLILNMETYNKIKFLSPNSGVQIFVTPPEKVDPEKFIFSQETQLQAPCGFETLISLTKVWILSFFSIYVYVLLLLLLLN